MKRLSYSELCERWVGNMSGAVCDLLCGLICLITLSYYRPTWDMSIRIYFMNRRIERHKREN